MRKYPDNECLGWRVAGADGQPGPYKWLTYAQTAAKVENIAGGLAHVGLQPKGRVGVFGTNSPEWMTTMQVCGAAALHAVSQAAQATSSFKSPHAWCKYRSPCFVRESATCAAVTLQACNRMSLYCVPLYDSLGENAIEYIINHSEASVVFAALDKLGNLAKALPHVLELVKTVVYWGSGDQAAAAVSLLWLNGYLRCRMRCRTC